MAESQLITRYKAENSDFLKKTKEAERALDQFGTKGTEIGNKIKAVTDLLNINVGALSKLAVGLAAAGAALKVAGDAIQKNEVVMDEWNKNVEAAKGAYDGFLNALNTGDISGYLHNIDNIVRAAREAYDAMDELGTFNAFNQINSEENRANLSEALANFKSGKGSAKAITAAADAVKEDLRQRQKYEQEYYEKAINNIAASRGVNASMLKDALSGKYGAYQDIKNTKMTGSKTVFYSGGMFGGGGSYQQAVPANDLEKLGNMLNHFTDDELQSLQAIGAQAKRTAREIADVDKQVAKYMKEGGGSGSGSGNKNKKTPAIEGSIRWYQEHITELNKQLGDAVSDDVRTQLRADIEIAKRELNRLSGVENKGSGAGVKMESGMSLINGDWNDGYTNWTAIHDDLSDFEDDIDIKPITEKEVAINKLAKSYELAKTHAEGAATAFSAVGSALATIEDPAAKVIGILSMAIANVAAAAGQAMAAKDTTSSGWAWIGAAAAITGTMLTSIAAIKQATAGTYANGGMIPGNHYSGDQQLAAVNAGELILNRAQQSNLASQLSGQSNGRREVEFRISGQELVGILRQESNIKSYR